MALPASASQNRFPEALRAYQVEDREAIETFLNSRPHLIPILEEAPAHIAAAFRRPHSLRLTVFRDYECPQFPELHIGVVTEMDTDTEWEAAEASVRCVYENWLIRLPRAEICEFLIRPEPR
jgi:hypothetical protein